MYFWNAQSVLVIVAIIAMFISVESQNSDSCQQGPCCWSCSSQIPEEKCREQGVTYTPLQGFTVSGTYCAYLRDGESYREQESLCKQHPEGYQLYCINTVDADSLSCISTECPVGQPKPKPQCNVETEKVAISKNSDSCQQGPCCWSCSSQIPEEKCREQGVTYTPLQGFTVSGTYCAYLRDGESYREQETLCKQHPEGYQLYCINTVDAVELTCHSTGCPVGQAKPKPQCNAGNTVAVFFTTLHLPSYISKLFYSILTIIFINLV